MSDDVKPKLMPLTVAKAKSDSEAKPNYENISDRSPEGARPLEPTSLEGKLSLREALNCIKCNGIYLSGINLGDALYLIAKGVQRSGEKVHPVTGRVVETCCNEDLGLVLEEALNRKHRQTVCKTTTIGADNPGHSVWTKEEGRMYPLNADAVLLLPPDTRMVVVPAGDNPNKNNQVQTSSTLSKG